MIYEYLTFHRYQKSQEHCAHDYGLLGTTTMLFVQGVVTISVNLVLGGKYSLVNVLEDTIQRGKTLITGL